jgi:hypothetical protein
MVRAAGQQLAVPSQRYHAFRLAAFATGTAAPAPAAFRVNYGDGTSTTTTLSVKMLTDTAATGDIVVHQADHAHRLVGGSWVDDSSVEPIVWGYELAADWQRTVTSITLPSNPDIHLVGVVPVILLDSSYGQPVLDHTNPAMYSYLTSVMTLWQNKVGFDGYRMDSVQNFQPAALRQLINSYWHSQYPNKWLLAEAAVAEPGLGHESDEPLPWQLHREQYTNPADKVNFTSVYDFDMGEAIRNTFGLQDSAVDGQFSLLQRSLSWDSRYDQPWNQITFFDFYENSTFLSIAAGSTYAEKLPRLRLAAAFLFAINRVPFLFSGDEYLLAYGQELPIGSTARRPGYLFSSEVQSNATYQDNYRYMQALIAMRKSTAALRSTEKLTGTQWILQGASLFGFVRRATGQGSVIALFNNSLLASGSGYGANDPSLTWADSRTLSVSGMRAWEGKLIRV